jgi:hypothetical protein
VIEINFDISNTEGTSQEAAPDGKPIATGGTLFHSNPGYLINSR